MRTYHESQGRPIYRVREVVVKMLSKKYRDKYN